MIYGWEVDEWDIWGVEEIRNAYKILVVKA
jgi:hypothetical protein